MTAGKQPEPHHNSKEMIAANLTLQIRKWGPRDSVSWRVWVETWTQVAGLCFYNLTCGLQTLLVICMYWEFIKCRSPGSAPGFLLSSSGMGPSTHIVKDPLWWIQYRWSLVPNTRITAATWHCLSEKKSTLWHGEMQQMIRFNPRGHSRVHKPTLCSSVGF